MTARLACLGLLVTVSLHARTPAPDSSIIHIMTLRGVDHLYNLDFALAEQTFDSLVALAPQDPRGHFFRSMIVYWKYILTGDRGTLESFLEQSARVVEHCEEMLARDQNNGMLKFYLGGIHGYRGLAYLRDGSTLSAVMSGRTGYSYLEEVVLHHEEVHDAQMGFGLFKYMVARVPSSFRWILNILGFSGDREGGLRCLKLAADSGTYARSEAAFFYAQFTYFEEREEEAFAYLQDLLDRHPQNTLFLITYASWEFRRHRLDSAMANAERAIALNTERDIRYGDEFAYAVLANFHFVQGNFAASVDCGERAIEKTENKDRVPNATYYTLGLSYELTGDRKKAVDAYRRTTEADARDNPWQYRSWRKAQQRLSRPLDSLDMALILAGNASTLKEVERALELYRKIIAQARSADMLAEALYETAALRFDRKEYREAMETLEGVFRLEPEEETWVLPHAHLMMARALKHLGHNGEIRKHLEAIEDFDDYDYQNRIETQAEEELAKLGESN